MFPSPHVSITSCFHHLIFPHLSPQVPGGLSLASLQEKVLCPLGEWLPNYSIHSYLLPTRLYRDEKPEEPKKDICLGPVDMQDSIGVLFQIKRGGDHMVDDRKVALFQLLHHGNQKFEENILPFKIIVQKISNMKQDPSMEDIRLVDGKGLFPDESGSWENPEYEDADSITGVKAFCISLNVIKNAKNEPDWKVKQAKKHLRLKKTSKLGEPINIDLDTEQKRILAAAKKFMVKRGAAGTSADVFGMMSMMFIGGNDGCDPAY